MEKKLIKLLLNKEFYEANKHYLKREMFPDQILGIYDVLVKAHEKYTTPLSLQDIRLLYGEAHPAATRASLVLIDELFKRIADEETPNLEAAKDIIKGLWRREHARQIAEEAIEITDGRKLTFEGVREKVDAIGDDYLPTSDLDITTTDIDALLAKSDMKDAYKFNIPSVATLVPGILPSRFMVLSARPETGKTAAWVSLTFGPGGFLDQGLSVHAIINEEPASATMMRGISCRTGMNYEQVAANRAMARGAFEKIRDQIQFIDSVDMSIDRLDLYCKTYKPNILVVDQLDKLGIDGDFARDDQKLREIYVGARRIAKRYGCAVIAISQLSFEAEGRRIVSHAMAENSRTGKAAEADVFIAIGKNPINENSMNDDFLRYWNVTKNKLTGKHGAATCRIIPEISRYEE